MSPAASAQPVLAQLHSPHSSSVSPTVSPSLILFLISHTLSFPGSPCPLYSPPATPQPTAAWLCPSPSAGHLARPFLLGPEAPQPHPSCSPSSTGRSSRQWKVQTLATCASTRDMMLLAKGQPGDGGFSAVCQSCSYVPYAWHTAPDASLLPPLLSGSAILLWDQRGQWLLAWQPSLVPLLHSHWLMPQLLSLPFVHPRAAASD